MKTEPSNFEDKMVQRMMQKVLQSMYEPIFKEVWLQPNTGAHDAIKALSRHLFREEFQMVIDVDLTNFFGSIDHLHLMLEKLLGKRYGTIYSLGILSECSKQGCWIRTN